MSGKPRLSGARAVLDHFGVPDAGTRAEVYAERKQERVLELDRGGRVRALPGRTAVRARRVPPRVADRGGVVVEERRADARADPGRTPRAARLRDVFAADLSGRDFARGKPDPEIFLAAGEALGLAPWECFVVEDAVVGIEAARAGGMAALGVARADDAELLTAAGADLVVTTLDDVDLDRLADGRLAIRSGSSG